MTKSATDQSTFRHARRNDHSRQPTEQELAAIKDIYLPGENGTAILMLHGFISTPLNLIDFATTFQERGYSVSVPLLAGHGTDLDDFAEHKWQHWLNSAINAYNILRAKHDKVFVIGLSMGSLLTINLAKQFNDIDHIYLLSPALALPLPLPLYYFIIKLLSVCGKKYFETVGGDLKKINARELGYSKMPLVCLLEMCKFIQHTRKILATTTTPASAYLAVNDHVISSKKSAKQLKKYGGPLEISWYKNSYHILTQDNDSQVILENIADSINDLLNMKTTATVG